MQATINNNLRLKIPYGEGSLSFDPIPYEGKFSELKEKANKDGLRMPTLKEAFAIALYSETWQKDKNLAQYSKLIANSMIKGAWIAADTGILYEKDKGFYVVDGITVNYDPSEKLFHKVNVDLNKKDLEKRLIAGDKNIKFVPEGNFELNEIPKNKIAQHPLIKALIGEEGAQQAQAAKKYWKIEISDLLKDGNPLYCSINNHHNPLNLVDYYFDYSRFGRCFGIDDKNLK